MDFLAGTSWSSMSTPRNWARPAVSPEIVARCGASAMHGPHHAAQILTTTGFPWSDARRLRNAARSNVGRAVGEDGIATRGDEPEALPPWPPQAGARSATNSRTGRSARRTTPPLSQRASVLVVAVRRDRRGVMLRSTVDGLP